MLSLRARVLMTMNGRLLIGIEEIVIVIEMGMEIDEMSAGTTEDETSGTEDATIGTEIVKESVQMNESAIVTEIEHGIVNENVIKTEIETMNVEIRRHSLKGSRDHITATILDHHHTIVSLVEVEEADIEAPAMVVEVTVIPGEDMDQLVAGIEVVMADRMGQLTKSITTIATTTILIAIANKRKLMLMRTITTDLELMNPSTTRYWKALSMTRYRRTLLQSCEVEVI